MPGQLLIRAGQKRHARGGNFLLCRQRGLPMQVRRPRKNANECEVVSSSQKLLIIPRFGSFSWELGNSLFDPPGVHFIIGWGFQVLPPRVLGSWWEEIVESGASDGHRGVLSVLLKANDEHLSPSCPYRVIDRALLYRLLDALFFTTVTLRVPASFPPVSWRREPSVYFLLLRSGLNCIKFVPHCCSSLRLAQ